MARRSTGKSLFHTLVVTIGGGTMTFAVFLILPLLQQISEGPEPDTINHGSIDTVLEPPPPAPEEEPPPEEEPEEEPPELDSEPQQQLDLDAMAAALNPGGAGSGSFLNAGDLLGKLGGGPDGGTSFNIADLGQRARPTFRPPPRLTPQMAAKTPGECTVIFIVNANGRVENPRVEQRTDPVFEKASLDAIRKWRFEPATRGGEPVRDRKRQTFDFPKS